MIRTPSPRSLTGCARTERCVALFAMGALVLWVCVLCVQYPVGCGCEAKVTSVVDLTVGYDSRNPPDYTPVSRIVG